MEKKARTITASLNGDLTALNFDWLGVDTFEALQVPAGGSPGGEVTPFLKIPSSRIEGTRTTGLTHGYVSSNEKTRVYEVNGLFEAPNLEGHRGGVEYYGFMNKNKYYYNFNFQAYNSTDLMYPGACAGFSCNISVGKDMAQSTGKCKQNWGNHTQLNHVYGLFFNTQSGKYRTLKLSSVGNNRYPLLNRPLTQTNSSLKTGPLLNGQTKKCHFVQTTYTDEQFKNYWFCGLAMNIAVSHVASQNRCHIFQVSRLQPIPLGYNNITTAEKLVILEKKRVGDSSSESQIKLFD